MKKSKLIAALLAVVMVGTLMAGCTKAPTNDKPSTGDPAVTPPSDDAKVRTDIILGEQSDVVSLDPHQGVDTTSMRALEMIYDTLVKFDVDGKIVPDLAKSWGQPDPTTYVFKLNEGVKFHNGEVLTANDVVFSLNREMKTPQVKIYTENITEVTAVDATTVQVKLSKPHAPFLMNMALTASSILNEKDVTAVEATGEKYGAKPVGTGPMTLDTWKVNESMKLVRNESYWGTKGAATSITLQVIPESTSRTIALETGEIDFLSLVPAVDVARIKSNADLKFIDAPNAGLSYVAFNQLVKPFDDVRVRKALSYAINKEDILTVILEGNGQIAPSILTSVSPVYNTEMTPLPYDIDKAKALLAEAGFADGFSTEIAVSGDERNRIAQLIQATYAQINVAVKIQLLEWGAYLDYISGKEHQIFLNGTASTMNPDSTMTSHFHTASQGATGNRWWYSNPKVDSLIEQARAEFDDEARKALYWEIQKIVIEEDAVLAPLTQKINTIAMVKGAEGVVLYKTDNHDFTNMTVKE